MQKKMTRADILSAADRGYCLLCGGTNGHCNCTQPSILLSPVHSNRLPAGDAAFDLDCLCDGTGRTRLPERDSGCTETLPRAFHFCEACRTVSDFDPDADLGRCPCGVILFHNFRPAERPPMDFSDLLNVEDLPRSALRKPKIYR